LARARALAARLREAGLQIPCADSQILPVLVGEADDAVAVMRRLLEAGVYVAAIRPPTVAPGTSRLRVSLMATHTDGQIGRAADAIIAAMRDVVGAS
ncbi:MAG: aminotransferase class I/II-fold pyridoxal phosphate-dependent enzyme, partial [Myxococcales bacterium]